MNQIIENNIKIEDMIYEFRGKQVMLDSDLANLYQCKNGTKSINLAVKRHINRFPERFMFQLTEEESKNIWFQVETKYKNIETRGGKYNKPYVFTEQGVAMLATVLKTGVSEKVSIDIMDAFVVMRQFIRTSLLDQKYVNNLVLENREKIVEIEKDVKLLQKAFDKLEEKEIKNKIYFNGQIYDAYSNILNIFKKANNNLIIIDSYADNTILDIVKRLKVNVIIITRKNNLLTKQDIEKYNRQYNNLSIVYDNTFHDRYFIIDKEIVYHCGASINRIGYKTFSINIISDKDVKDLLIKRMKKNNIDGGIK